MGREIVFSHLVGFDAVHLACAESGKADVFLTTDDRLLKLAKRLAKKLHVTVENPLDWMNIQMMTPQQIRAAGLGCFPVNLAWLE